MSLSRPAAAIAPRRPAIGLFVALLLGALPRPALHAQAGAPLTLDDALARALGQFPTLALAGAEVQRAEGELHAARSAGRNRFLPEVTVTLGYQRLVQNQFDAIARRFGLDPAALNGDPVSTTFNARNVLTGAAVASLVPFDGGVGAARTRAARAGRALAEVGVTGARARLELDVITAYADLHLARRTAEIADSALAQAERAVAVARTAVAEGSAPEFELVRAAAAREAQLPAVAEAATLRTLAALRLRQLVGLPDSVPLQLADGPDDASPPRAPAVPATAGAAAPLAVQQAELVLARDEGLLDAARRERLPTLALSATHQRLAYPRAAGLSWTRFFPNTTVNAEIRLPIDLTGRTGGAIAAARGAVQAAHAQARLARQAHEFRTAEARAALAQAEAEWRAGLAATEQATRAYAIAEARFAAGRSSALELQDARLQLASARLTRARAARNHRVAAARIARLDQLPLGEE